MLLTNIQGKAPVPATRYRLILTENQIACEVNLSGFLR